MEELPLLSIYFAGEKPAAWQRIVAPDGTKRQELINQPKLSIENIDNFGPGIVRQGHTRADFEQVVARCRQVGLTLAPTFIPFTPWTTLAGYYDLLRTVDALDLVEQVAPIQLALRLLIPRRSRLLELDRERLGVELGPFDESRLVYPWRHPDPRVDRLQERVAGVVGRRLTASWWPWPARF